jgi:hypothetical protein
LNTLGVPLRDLQKTREVGSNLEGGRWFGVELIFTFGRPLNGRVSTDGRALMGTHSPWTSAVRAAPDNTDGGNNGAPHLQVGARWTP